MRLCGTPVTPRCSIGGCKSPGGRLYLGSGSRSRVRTGRPSVGGPQKNAHRKNGKKGTSAMTSEKSQNVQDVFLNHIRKNKTPVTIFLVNGVKLQGIITWFDNFSVLLRRDGHSQLVYKHAISTVMPTAPISLFEGDKDAPA
jgi:host factor-I protein